jgi:hypothetical protein
VGYVKNAQTECGTETRLFASLKDKEKLALAEHKFEDGDHTFDLEKTVVLAKTTEYHQRLIREAIEIRKYPNNFNRDQGVELSSTWNSVIRPCTHPPTNFSHRATPTTPTTNPTGSAPPLTI